MISYIMECVLSSAQLQAALGLFATVAAIMLVTTAVAVAIAIITNKKKA